MSDTLTGETTELLQAMIRNACVNDGTPDSGEEVRNADLLQHVLEGVGLDVQRFESHPGRTSVVARIEGSDPTAPSLCLMGHTDVVPVSPDGWSRDPFGGDLVDGEVWGRGAIDMLNLTSSMAVAFRHLARTGFRPKGTLIYFGVADEEAGGHWGAEWMFENHPEAIDADYVLTELGGWSSVDDHGHRRITVNVGEKGIAWRRLRVHGTPGHGSMPYGTDNALVKAAEVVRRLAEFRPATQITDIWRAQVDAMAIDPELRSALTDPTRVWDELTALPPRMARACHAMTHTTISPNVVHGAPLQKTNVIPDIVDLVVDIRTLPGTTAEDVTTMITEALGDLAPHVTIGEPEQQAEGTQSPLDTRLWEVLSHQTQVAYPGSSLVPGLVVGGTDARFYRQRGRVGYGAGLFSPGMDMATFGSRFHGHDERIDVASLGLATDLWVGVAREMLS
jgi:acetylornithine deacetylase/succinyl-diaminopimelate desuccinylase-like protein